MNDNDGIQRQIEEHIQWCRCERDRLILELAECQNGNLSLRTRTTGEPVTRDALDHISYLELTIEQLDCVIACDLSPTDRRPTLVVEAEIISLTSRRNSISPTR